jgi:site-specific DNA-methyltransferase (adenine-specific)
MNRWLNQIIEGDCLEVLKTMPDNSVDSIVTDPPYELGFMGKKWDSTGIAYNVELWQECLRVLKYGGYLLAFGGTRTYHRMTCAIEDAGFEIRDCIQWIYGSGFPKSMDISKAIDKKLGAEREVIGKGRGVGKKGGETYSKYGGFKAGEIEITASATELARKWNGWGTALKPANEPIVLARKPLSEKTIAENVMKWGTGGLNIDGCRIGTEGGGTRCNKRDGLGNCLGHPDRKGTAYGVTYHAKESEEVEGRFPANVILDEEAGKMLDEQSGILKSGALKPYQENHQNASSYKMNRYKTFVQPANEGGASRFFYCAKASKAERRESKHPTVKPLNLMRYLVRLVTPPNGTVLDPFAGSGTTLEAAMLEGFCFVGIEEQAEYIPDIQARVKQAQAQSQQSLFG